MPFVSRTRATLRSAEFGFFGVAVYTRVQTPRFCGAPRRAGVLVFVLGVWRPLRTSWLTVGKRVFPFVLRVLGARKARRGRSPVPKPRAMVATAEGVTTPPDGESKRKTRSIVRSSGSLGNAYP